MSLTSSSTHFLNNSLGSLCLTALSEFLLISHLNLPCYKLRPFPLILSLLPGRRSWHPPPYNLLSDSFPCSRIIINGKKNFHRKCVKNLFFFTQCRDIFIQHSFRFLLSFHPGWKLCIVLQSDHHRRSCFKVSSGDIPVYRSIQIITLITLRDILRLFIRIKKYPQTQGFFRSS